MTPWVVARTIIPSYLHSSVVRPSYPVHPAPPYAALTDFIHYTSTSSRIRDLLTRHPVYGFRLDKGDDGILSHAYHTLDMASTILLSNLYHTTDRTRTLENLTDYYQHRLDDISIPSQTIMVAPHPVVAPPPEPLTKFDMFQSTNFHNH
jgi:hypothetical protein